MTTTTLIIMIVLGVLAAAGGLVELLSRLGPVETYTVTGTNTAAELTDAPTVTGR